MPTNLSFAISLAFVGLTSLTLMTTANARVQTTTEPAMRGRVMALYMAIFAGGTPLGAPLVGWVADQHWPRWAIGVAAASGLIAAAAVKFWMVRYQRLRVRIGPRTKPRWVPRLRVRHRGDGLPATTAIRIVTAKADLAGQDRDRETATREIAVVEATSPR